MKSEHFALEGEAEIFCLAVNLIFWRIIRRQEN